MLDIGYAKEQNNVVMDKNSRDPVHCWLVLVKAFQSASKYLYAILGETGIDDTDFRTRSALKQRAFTGEYDRAKGPPYAWLDQYGR